jgi:hypothetical protein
MKAFVIPANSSERVREINFDQDQSWGMSSRDMIQANIRGFLLRSPFLQKRTRRATTC